MVDQTTWVRIVPIGTDWILTIKDFKGVIWVERADDLWWLAKCAADILKLSPEDRPFCTYLQHNGWSKKGNYYVKP